MDRWRQHCFFENIYEVFDNSADFQFLMGLIYMNNARFEEKVREYYFKCGDYEKAKKRLEYW